MSGGCRPSIVLESILGLILRLTRGVLVVSHLYIPRKTDTRITCAVFSGTVVTCTVAGTVTSWHCTSTLISPPPPCAIYPAVFIVTVFSPATGTKNSRTTWGRSSECRKLPLWVVSSPGRWRVAEHEKVVGNGVMQAETVPVKGYVSRDRTSSYVAVFQAEPRG